MLQVHQILFLQDRDLSAGLEVASCSCVGDNVSSWKEKMTAKTLGTELETLHDLRTMDVLIEMESN